MQQEIEAKFLRVDPDAIRAKLTALGAHCEQPMRLMRRAMFDHPDGRNQKSIKLGKHSQKLRVRDEGDKVTITYKASNDSNYVHEVETTVGSYQEMTKILEAVGFVIYTYQESRRETRKYKSVEVVIDEWPWLTPYIEIEGPDEISIKTAAKDLGFDWDNAKFGSVDTVYMDQYKKMKITDSVGELPEARFDMPVSKFFKDKE